MKQKLAIGYYYNKNIYSKNFYQYSTNNKKLRTMRINTHENEVMSLINIKRSLINLLGI